MDDGLFPWEKFMSVPIVGILGKIVIEDRHAGPGIGSQWFDKRIIAEKNRALMTNMSKGLYRNANAKKIRKA